MFRRHWWPAELSEEVLGHIRQLDAVASRFLAALAARSAAGAAGGGAAAHALVDVDDTIIEVHGYAKQGAGFGYSGVRGLNALLATVTTDGVGAAGRGAAATERIVRAHRGARNGWSPTPSKPSPNWSDRVKQAAAAGRLGVLRAPPSSAPRSAPAPTCRSPYG